MKVCSFPAPPFPLDSLHFLLSCDLRAVRFLAPEDLLFLSSSSCLHAHFGSPPVSLAVDGGNLAPPLRLFSQALEATSLIYRCRSPPQPPRFQCWRLVAGPVKRCKINSTRKGSRTRAKQTILKSGAGGAQEHELHSETTIPEVVQDFLHQPNGEPGFGRR